MAGGHGGARSGAGRKRKSEQFPRQIDKADRAVAERLVDNIATLQGLADGATEEVTTEYAPAGMVMVKGFERDSEGKIHKVEKLAFPDKPADELVPIKRKIVVHGPDLGAATYLVDYIRGKPGARPEEAAEDEVKIPRDIVAMIARVYDVPDPAPPESADGDSSGS